MCNPVYSLRLYFHTQLLALVLEIGQRCDREQLCCDNNQWSINSLVRYNKLCKTESYAF